MEAAIWGLGFSVLALVSRESGWAVGEVMVMDPASSSSLQTSRGAPRAHDIWILKVVTPIFQALNNHPSRSSTCCPSARQRGVCLG